MKQILLIKADTNDGDYVTSEHEVEGFLKDNLDVIVKVANAIKNCTNRHNWQTGDCEVTPLSELYKDVLTEEDIDFFDEHTPYGEYGIHTIKSVRLLTVTEELKLV